MPENRAGSKKIGASILKVVGVLTAVISLSLGIREIVSVFKDSAARKSKAAELAMEARGLASSGAYSQAWQSVSQAVELAPEYRYAQVEISLAWLRNAHISSRGGETSFTEIVQKILPVLYREIDTTRRVYSATLLAHVGWADFLLFKEGDGTVDVDAQFKRALAIDSTNLYAHAMYGFWMLYPGHDGGTIEEANRHFAAALRGGKDTMYVRHLMIAAFQNAANAACEAQTIKVANEMRVNHEYLEATERQRIVSEAYWMYRDEITKEVSKLLSPEDQLDTFRWLTSEMNVESTPYLKKTLADLQSAAAHQRNP